MDLKDVIVLKSGDYSVVMQDKYVLTSTKMPSFISALIFNKGELSLKLLRIDLYDGAGREKLIESIILNNILSPNSEDESKRTYMQRFDLTTSIVPYFVLSFEYQGVFYQIEEAWKR